MKRIVVFLLLILILLGCTAKDSAPVNAGTESRQPETAPVGEAVDEVFAAVVTLAPATPDLLPTLPPTPTPTPSPEPTPTPDPTPTPEPTKDPNRPMVALTFDDGPNIEFTPQVLDLLEQYGVKGTFFVVGSHLNAESKPILQRMADLGCDIGIHGLTHVKMTSFSYSENVVRFQKMREKISDQVEGGYTPHLMRPPYGTTSKSVRRACKTAELASIRWSVDTLDWKTKNTGKVIKTVKSEVKNGSIVLFHDRLDATVEALKELIPWLLEEGYDIVTVTELLESAGPIQYGEDYRAKPGT